jgi:hypothetical protein
LLAAPTECFAPPEALEIFWSSLDWFIWSEKDPERKPRKGKL